MIDIDSLASEISDAFTAYSQAVTNAMKKGIDKTAEKAQNIVSDHAPVGSSNRQYSRKNKMVSRRSGKYKKAIMIKTAFDGKFDKRDVVCVKPNEHALAHLLENGHAMRQGGRAKALPHFVYGQEYIENNLQRNIEKEVGSI